MRSQGTEESGWAGVRTPTPGCREVSHCAAQAALLAGLGAGVLPPAVSWALPGVAVRASETRVRRPSAAQWSSDTSGAAPRAALHTLSFPSVSPRGRRAGGDPPFSPAVFSRFSSHRRLPGERTELEQTPGFWLNLGSHAGSHLQPWETAQFPFDWGLWVHTAGQRSLILYFLGLIFRDGFRFSRKR